MFNLSSHQENFSQLSSLDRVSVVKGWMRNATDLFVRFCIHEPVWNFLAKDQRNPSPYLKKINKFCLSTECSHLSENYLNNISTIIRRDLSLFKLYISTTQGIKCSQENLLEIHCDITQRIAEDYSSSLLRAHFQAIQRVRKLQLTLLETYLKIAQKHALNSAANLLTHHICGCYNYFLVLSRQVDFKELFFQEFDGVRNLKPELLESYLQNIYIFCNFFTTTLIIKHYLMASSKIFELNSSIFQTHINNVNTVQLPFLEDYINITFYFSDNQQNLELYIKSVDIIKGNFEDLKRHQQNTKALLELQTVPLKDYFISIQENVKNIQGIAKYTTLLRS